MNVTQDMVDKLGDVRKVRLEAEIVDELASRLALSPEEAMERYFASDLAKMVEDNEFGVRYLDASYLLDEVSGAAAL